MTLLSGIHLLATPKETKIKLNTDFDIPLTEEAVKKRKEDKKLEEVIISIDSPGEGPPGKGPPAEGPVNPPGEEPAEGSAAASLAQGRQATEGPAGNTK